MELSDTYTPEVSFTQHRRFINASTKRLFGRKTDLIITLIVPRMILNVTLTEPDCHPIVTRCSG